MRTWSRSHSGCSHLFASMPMSETARILDNKDYWDEYLPLPMQNHGLVMKRKQPGEGPRGTVMTNVPHRVEGGSPDGFEFGYGGSGPSDLALNAVEHLIRTLAEEGAIDPPSEHYTAEDGDVERGQVSKMAFQLSPTFKSKFVAPAPTSGGSVEYETLKDWLLQQLESRSRE